MDNICFPFSWYSDLLSAGWGSVHATGPRLQEHFRVDTPHLLTVYCLFFAHSVMTSLHKQEWQATPKRNWNPSLDSFGMWAELCSLEVPALFLLCPLQRWDSYLRSWWCKEKKKKKKKGTEYDECAGCILIWFMPIYRHIGTSDTLSCVEYFSSDMQET